ncbi:MAG: diaminopimelate decarboxylase, partial [Desulfuromonadales bacterium]
MPMSEAFKSRLFPVVKDVAAHYETPFHIYDEAGIRETGESLKKAFAGIDGYQEFFAVKALPNRRILEIMKDIGFGFDCSSIPELILSRQVGARGEEIMFTSNNTSREEFLFAEKDGGCTLNLDDISLIDKVPAPFPELVCFRYNPGPRRTGNIIIGNPVEAKYGVTHEQVVEAYRLAQSR